MSVVRIPLTQGKYSIIDEEDALKVVGHSWYARRGSNPMRETWYAATDIDGHMVLMHRFLEDAQEAMLVDHRNGDGLDNRRCNRRVCTKSQNQVNAPLSRLNTSGYRGAQRSGYSKQWRADIGINGERKYLGLFDTVEEAARAYDVAAREAFGEFARLNFPEQGEASTSEIEGAPLDEDAPTLPKPTCRKDNTSGYRGVTWDRRRGRWAGQLSIKGKHLHAGYFDTPEAASAAVESKRLRESEAA